MRKFVTNLFVFLTIVLLFNGIVFVFANDNYYKGYKDFPSKNYHFFLIADSHGIPLEKSAEKFKIFNFSASSDSYLDSSRKINYLIENKYKIKTIYLTVDNHTLSPYRDQFNNADKSVIYTSTIDTNYLKEKYLKYYFPIFQIKVNPLLRIYLESKIAGVFSPKKNAQENVMWSKLPKKDQLKRAEERISGQFPTPSRSKNLEKILLNIITVCKANNIELIGIKFPLSSSYSTILGDKNYGADQIFISKGLKVIDVETIFVNHEEYFGDQDHLNFKGGKELVESIFNKTKNP